MTSDLLPQLDLEQNICLPLWCHADYVNYCKYYILFPIPKLTSEKLGLILPFFLPQWSTFLKILYKTVVDKLMHLSYKEKIFWLHKFKTSVFSLQSILQSTLQL